MNRLRAILRHVVKVAAILLALAACAVALLQVQQWMLCWRAERLLSDMQAIELHKTTWAQAQVLMHRWGAWGHYDGDCTADSCKYLITLTNWYLPEHLPGGGGLHRSALWLMRTAIYQRLGGRWGQFYAGFIVQDGTIRRTRLGYTIGVPPHIAAKDDEYGYELIAIAQSRSSLNRYARSENSHWILGDDEQLADHPYYKGGRPSGCEICMASEVTYSTTTPQDEIRRLTAFDLSCITRWRPCTRVEDLMPAAKPWHLYWLAGDPPEPDFSKVPPTACATPIWALGRDAISVLSIEVLSASAKRNTYDGSPYEEANVRLLETLKGGTSRPSKSTLNVYPYSGELTNAPFYLPERLESGRKYLVLVPYPLSDIESGSRAIDGAPGIRLNRCGVLSDTPQNRVELARGFAQNDELRVAEF